jgi:hypothetical protein
MVGVFGLLTGLVLFAFLAMVVARVRRTRIITGPAADENLATEIDRTE